MLTTSTFEQWLATYGAAWEARDPAAAARLFTADGHYHWTPFEAPKVGHAEIAVAWEQATSRQRDVAFRFTILSVDETRGMAHWHARFIRIATGVPVEIDGVLMAEFDPSGLCRAFREWWHSSEVT